MPKRRSGPKEVQPEAAPGKGWTFLLNHGFWLFPLILFAVLRLFSADTYYLLAGDQCTFLELARTFPKHQLYNHELYLIHPPMFGYSIGLLNFVLPLLISGLAATLLFAVINFFAIRNLALAEELPRTAVFVGLIYLAISRPAVAYDSHVARVSILVCGSTLAILAFLRFVREPNRKTLVPVLAANVFCLLTSDQALLLLPCEALLFWARSSRRDWKLTSVLAASSVAALLVWPAVRFVEYRSRPDVPAGIDGTIEVTKDVPLSGVIQPNLLPLTNAHRSLSTQTEISASKLKPAIAADFATDLMAPPVLAIPLIVLLLAAAFVRPERRMRAVQWLGLSLLCLIPVALGMNEWYGMAYITPFALVLMEGAAAVLAWVGSKTRISEAAVTLSLGALCLAGSAMWWGAGPRETPSYRPHGGSHFLLNRPTITRGSVISRVFESAPRDTGIMSPVLLTPEIVYLTDKRVVSLPFDPALLDRYIAEYRIRYLLTSSQFLKRYNKPEEDLYFSAAISRYIVEHPERYQLVRSVQENYAAFYPPMTYYVFEVK